MSWWRHRDTIRFLKTFCIYYTDVRRTIEWLRLIPRMKLVWGQYILLSHKAGSRQKTCKRMIGKLTMWAVLTSKLMIWLLINKNHLLIGSFGCYVKASQPAVHGSILPDDPLFASVRVGCPLIGAGMRPGGFLRQTPPWNNLRLFGAPMGHGGSFMW